MLKTQIKQFQISIRSGGHDYICANLKNDSFHFDMRKMNKIEMVSQNIIPDKVITI
jgi:hypothetical protein